MEYQVHLQTIAARQPTAVVRRRAIIAELPKVVPDACGVVWNVIRAGQIKGAGRNIALYLDDQINLEVGVEMDAPFASHGEVIGSSIPSGTVAAATHLGPYHQLARAHQAIRDWCARHGHTLAGPNWEIYAHWENSWKSDPSRIRTDVFYLLTT